MSLSTKIRARLTILCTWLMSDDEGLCYWDKVERDGSSLLFFIEEATTQVSNEAECGSSIATAWL